MGKHIDLELHSKVPYEEIPTPRAVVFLVRLQRSFNARRKELLAIRVEPQARLDPERCRTFLAGTRNIREVAWTWRGYVEAGCAAPVEFHSSIWMEDAASGEVSRARLWQSVHHGAMLDDGCAVTTVLCDAYIEQGLASAREKFDATRYDAYEQAAELMRALIEAPGFPDFHTVPAYTEVMAEEKFKIIFWG